MERSSTMVASLSPGSDSVIEKIAGPAIILQTDSTTVVPPGATVHADRGGNLILRLED